MKRAVTVRDMEQIGIVDGQSDDETGIPNDPFERELCN